MNNWKLQLPVLSIEDSTHPISFERLATTWHVNNKMKTTRLLCFLLVLSEVYVCVSSRWVLVVVEKLVRCLSGRWVVVLVVLVVGPRQKRDWGDFGSGRHSLTQAGEWNPFKKSTHLPWKEEISQASRIWSPAFLFSYSYFLDLMLSLEVGRLRCQLAWRD